MRTSRTLPADGSINSLENSLSVSSKVPGTRPWAGKASPDKLLQTNSYTCIPKGWLQKQRLLARHTYGKTIKQSKDGDKFITQDNGYLWEGEEDGITRDNNKVLFPKTRWQAHGCPSHHCCLCLLRISLIFFICSIFHKNYFFVSECWMENGLEWWKGRSGEIC